MKYLRSHRITLSKELFKNVLVYFIIFTLFFSLCACSTTNTQESQDNVQNNIDNSKSDLNSSENSEPTSDISLSAFTSSFYKLTGINLDWEFSDDYDEKHWYVFESDDSFVPNGLCRTNQKDCLQWLCLTTGGHHFDTDYYNSASVEQFHKDVEKAESLDYKIRYTLGQIAVGAAAICILTGEDDVDFGLNIFFSLKKGSQIYNDWDLELDDYNNFECTYIG